MSLCIVGQEMATCIDTFSKAKKNTKKHYLIFHWFKHYSLFHYISIGITYLQVFNNNVNYSNVHTQLLLSGKFSNLQWFLAHLTHHVSYCHHWASVVCCPSVNFSHFNQLLWSNWANLNQALVEWSLGGPLPKLGPVILISNQDGHQAKNRKKGGWNFNCPLLL